MRFMRSSVKMLAFIDNSIINAAKQIVK